jgi:anti-sigma regulatory factor (Ser/Thr protein kinase)
VHDHVEAEFECTPESVKAAREFVRAALGAWGLGDPDGAAALLTSELATNAVVHARTSYRLRVEYRAPRLVVSVLDGSAGRVARQGRGRPPDARGGRGLTIVDELADAWGTRARDGGKEVWFAVDVVRSEVRDRPHVGAVIGG